MNNELANLQRATLNAHHPRLLARGRNWTKSDVWLIEVAGRTLVLKDTRARSWLVRWAFGRWLLRREFSILTALGDVDGVPHVQKMLDADAFVMDYIEGTDIGKLTAVSEATIARLVHLVAQLHAHGIAHGDPHGRNILITATGEAYLIDFATAARRDSWPWLWRQLQQQDLRRVAKMKQRFTPHLLTAAEERLLATPSRAYRIAKAFKQMLQWLTLKPLRRKSC